MRTSKVSRKRFISNLIERVKKDLARTGSNNIAIYCPHLQDEEIELLRSHFKVVQREPLGYVKFEV